MLRGMAAPRERYVPAAGRPWLTGSYDMTVGLSMREAAWRPVLVDAVAGDVPHGGTVVEVGCGTGSLTTALAALRPDESLLEGRLPAMLAAAGFGASRRQGALRTVWGTLELWRTRRAVG
jgi:trans-aconitate methyltransferase